MGKATQMLLPALKRKALSEPFDMAVREVAKSRVSWKRYRVLVEDGASAYDPRAVYEMAQWHLHGHPRLRIEPDTVQGIKLLRVAAEHVCAAAYDLGVCYELGIGVAIDLEAALQQYKQAAHLGSVFGRAALADLFARGTGEKRDKASAKAIARTLGFLHVRLPDPLHRTLLYPRWR